MDEKQVFPDFFFLHLGQLSRSYTTVTNESVSCRQPLMQPMGGVTNSYMESRDLLLTWSDNRNIHQLRGRLDGGVVGIGGWSRKRQGDSHHHCHMWAKPPLTCMSEPP